MPKAPPPSRMTHHFQATTSAARSRSQSTMMKSEMTTADGTKIKMHLEVKHPYERDTKAGVVGGSSAYGRGGGHSQSQGGVKREGGGSSGARSQYDARYGGMSKVKEEGDHKPRDVKDESKGKPRVELAKEEPVEVNQEVKRESSWDGPDSYRVPREFWNPVPDVRRNQDYSPPPATTHNDYEYQAAEYDNHSQPPFDEYLPQRSELSNWDLDQPQSYATHPTPTPVTEYDHSLNTLLTMFLKSSAHHRSQHTHSHVRLPRGPISIPHPIATRILQTFDLPYQQLWFAAEPVAEMLPSRTGGGVNYVENWELEGERGFGDRRIRGSVFVNEAPCAQFRNGGPLISINVTDTPMYSTDRRIPVYQYYRDWNTY